MKGYVKVDRVDLLSAIIGFGLKYDTAKEIKQKGINLYYDKFYTQSGKFNRWWNRKKTPTQFVRDSIGAFGTWSDVLHEVLTPEENAEVDWWCFTSQSKIAPLKDLYRASGAEDYVLLDNELASMVNKYKTYLEEIK